ncbi:MAG: hypothetical protein RSD27_04810 [Ruthenibacterium sp.]
MNQCVKTGMRKRVSCTLLAVLLLCALAWALPITQVQAASVPIFITDLDATATVAEGGSVTLAVALSNPAGATYQWYKNSVAIPSATSNIYKILAAKKEDEGTYYVEATEPGSTSQKVKSTACKLTLGTPPAATSSGALSVTSYTVQDASGAEKQRIGVGEKCQIVIGLRDGRFKTMPTKTDAYGNIANFKITSTSSFATPTFGDLRMTTPKIVDGDLEYAVVFNDIMYMGGDTKLGFDVSYNDQSIAMQNVVVGISQCVNPSEVSTSKPSVMVKNSSYGGANVNAGTAFPLVVTSYNTSKLQGITDVTVSLSLPATITLAGGSNVALHDMVPPSGSFSDTFALQVQNSAETGVANVTIAYSFYVQGTDAPLTSTQIITVPITQPDRFSFTSLDIPDEVYAGEENTITLNFVNKGKGILYNLSTEISGNINDPGQNQYIGNLASGTEGSVDFTVKTDGIGPVVGTITVIYEDVNGNEQKRTQEYSFNVIAAPKSEEMPMPDDMNPDGMPSAGMPWWGWLLIVGGAAGAGGTVIAVVKKKKAKQRAAALADEDDGDEGF